MLDGPTEVEQACRAGFRLSSAGARPRARSFFRCGLPARCAASILPSPFVVMVHPQMSQRQISGAGVATTGAPTSSGTAPGVAATSAMSTSGSIVPIDGPTRTFQV